MRIRAEYVFGMTGPHSYLRSARAHPGKVFVGKPYFPTLSLLHDFYVAISGQIVPPLPGMAGLAGNLEKLAEGGEAAKGVHDFGDGVHEPTYSAQIEYRSRCQI